MDTAKFLQQAREKNCKGIISAKDTIEQQARVYLELLHDDSREAMLVGPTAKHTTAVPGYPNSLMGCSSFDLENIAGFSGLTELFLRSPADVTKAIMDDKEFFHSLSRFLVCTPQISMRYKDDDAGFRGSSFGSEAWPTATQRGKPYAFVLCQGPLRLLSEMLAKSPQKDEIQKRLAQAKYIIELVYRLYDIICREGEADMKASHDILWKSCCKPKGNFVFFFAL